VRGGETLRCFRNDVLRVIDEFLHGESLRHFSVDETAAVTTAGAQY
jgi:hypothetical protein